MSYRDSERNRLVALRQEIFNDPGNGLFFGKEREFVLKDPILNLWEGIRKDAVYYFAEHDIQWWKGEESGPCGHLLSSQIACVNHLYPIRQRQDLATMLLRGLDPSVESAHLVDGGYVEFEFIGERQHLKERGFTRGANCTSVDAVMIGKLTNNVRCMFLIEWKYTESYTETDMYIPERGKVYDGLITDAASPFKYKDPRAYYFEPFYQLMRQTLLGWQLCKNSDHGCTEYRHVHIVPAGNKELLEKVTSPQLRELGTRIMDVWRAVLANPERFISTTPEKLLTPVSMGVGAAAPLDYLRRRYWGHVGIHDRERIPE